MTRHGGSPSCTTSEKLVADNPSLTCRLPGMECRSPVRVILDRRLRTPTDARLFEDEMVPVWFICARDEMEPNAAALQEAGAEIIPVEIDAHGLPAIREALDQLARRGITRLLVEGGPSVAHVLLDGDLVDEAVIYQGSYACRQRRPAALCQRRA